MVEIWLDLFIKKVEKSIEIKREKNIMILTYREMRKIIKKGGCLT